MPGPRLTAVLLLLFIVLVVVALLRFTAAGPRFRAADHPTLRACMAAIPSEWAAGSLERTRAERACEHQERQRRGS